MKNLWLIPENDVHVGNKKALRHKITKETSVFGKYGEIYEFSNEKIGIIVKNKHVAKKFFKISGSAGDEFFLIRPLTELTEVCKILKVPRTLKAQLKLAGG